LVGGGCHHCGCDVILRSVFRLCPEITRITRRGNRIAMSTDRLLERFLRYVAVDTTARDDAGTYPSSPGQLELGRMLVAELKAMGITDAEQDEHGIVMATVPASIASHVDAPRIAFNAHVDTSPETTGKNVKPQVIRNYAGGDIPLSGDRTRVIRVVDNPELASLHGKTLVTTDGTTLLGADDKSGLAVIMEAAQRWIENKDLPRGPVRLLFTCDEEIGHGVDHVDLKKLGATACYTLDGSAAGEIDIETFSADLAIITITGVNIHPSIGKGRMKNALRAAGTFLDQLPAELSPECTDGRQGFLHPYTIDGGVAEVTIRVLIRDFDTANLARHAEILRRAAADTREAHPGVKVDVRITTQYRNMADGLAKEPRAVAYAQAAYEKLGIKPKLSIIRGGTDGSRLTELGLPTPNLSTGEHNPHSPLEWTCLEEMEHAVNVVLKIGEVWAERR
jgi:tripeptide aminopeptidase